MLVVAGGVEVRAAASRLRAVPQPETLVGRGEYAEVKVTWRGGGPVHIRPGCS